jgi:GT2 family glycosyltransferase
LKPYEVVVADDNSYQPIESISKKHGCKYIKTQGGRKLPHIAMRALARELGTFSTAGDIILYLDGDIIPSPYLVELLSAYHSRFQGHVVVKVPRRYRITTEHMLIGNPLYSLHSTKETCLSFEQFTSDCFSVGKDVITNIGGWDTNFIGWGEEDIELAYRFHLAGIPIILPEHPLFFCTHIDHSVNHQDNYLSLLKHSCKITWNHELNAQS